MSEQQKRSKIIILILVILMSIAAMLAASTIQSGTPVAPLLRFVLMLPLVFVWPGYALVASTLPVHELGRMAQLALSVGVSLFVNVLGGFILNRTPLGLDTLSWALLLGGTTVLAGGVALVRHLRLNSSPLSVVNPVRLDRRHALGPMILFGLALVLAVSALQLDRNSVEQYGSGSFTQLWILPKPGTTASVRIGIINRENRPVQYKLQVKQGTEAIGAWPALELASDQNWEVELPLSPGASGEVQATLYRLDAPGAVYRQVTLKGRK